jgi:putative ABC transport system permease protein
MLCSSEYSWERNLAFLVIPTIKSYRMMIQSYFRIALRNILKRKLYSFINAFGLSIGLAFCMLIYAFISDEKSFDQFHVNKDRIYRLEQKTYDARDRNPEGDYNYSASLPLPLLGALKDEIPEVEYGTHFTSGRRGAMRYGDKVFTEEYVLVDRDFFKMFSFPLLQGNREKLFTGKNEIVLTPEIATKYFGAESPLGKEITLFLEDEKVFTVAGVIEAPPSNSSLNFTILIPMENAPEFKEGMNQWSNFAYPTFIQLSQPATPSLLAGKLETVIQKYMGDKLARWMQQDNVPKDVKYFELQLSNLSDIHLNTNVSWERVSDPKYSLILGAIALLILLIACINYISLALTSSTSRRLEVGIRKVAGAQRNQLVYQFGIESIAIATVSLFIALALVLLFLPYFNDFTGKSITLDYKRMVEYLAVGLVLTLIVGVLAGSYPSMFLSRFKAASVLKGGFTSRLQAGFTKPLVVIQFALSAFLITSSLIMFQQMDFITSKDLGYDKDQVLIIPTQAGDSDESDQVVEQYRQRLEKEPDVVSVAGTSNAYTQGYSRFGYEVKGEVKVSYTYAADHHYLETLGIELVAGRNFDAQNAGDSTSLIINEALVKDMSWNEPLQEHLNWLEDSVGPGYRIIGVVKDHHFLSLERGVAPMFISTNTKKAGHLTTMLVKIKGSNYGSTIESLQQAWKELYPNRPFDYAFLDQQVAQQYESYKRWMDVVGLSTVFALIIACLGLFGLSGINALNRTKEIGIRKVIGADIANIFVLLNSQYVWLALIAFVLAVPASWYTMNQWLSSFTYRIEIGWEIFLISTMSGVLIAMLTVSYHAIKAATINPAETLKYE